jgi:hypothetical protein
VRPEHSEPRSTVDARIDTLTPLWIPGEFEKNTSTKGERFRFGDENVRPMNVNSGLHLGVHVTRFGTCDETSTFLDNGMHQRSEFKDSFIWEYLWTFVIEIDEKLEHVSFLLHHIQFLTEAYCVYTLYVKFVKLFKWNLKNSTIHKDVRPRTLICEPFLHTMCKEQIL